MPSLGLAVALSLTIGLLAQSCDVGDFTIDDLQDTIIVANASASQKAFVKVTADQSSVRVYLPPGADATFVTLVASDYSVLVQPADTGLAAAYHDRLLELRDRLQEMSLTPEAPGSDVASAVTDLYLVQQALSQMDAGNQTCRGKIKSGVDNHVTINWTNTGGTGVWVLSCG